MENIFRVLENKFKTFDIRYESLKELKIKMVNGNIESFSNSVSEGYAVRVVKDDIIYWTFISGGAPEVEKIKFEHEFKAGKPLGLAPVEPKQERVIVDGVDELESVDIASKLEFLRSVDKIFMDKGVKSREILYSEWVAKKRIVSSDGLEVEYTMPYVYLRVMLSHSENGKIASLRRAWGIIGGWKLVDNEELRAFLGEAAEKVKRIVHAPHVKPGRYDVVVDGDLNHLLAHEAFGHASEADILREHSILKGKVSKKLASPMINLVDDKKFVVRGIKGFGWIPFDDEGVGGGKTYLIEEGVFRGYLTNRETSEEFGLELTGNGRAQDWENFVVVRMTNTLIEPSEKANAVSNEELLEQLKNGLLLRFGRGGQVNPTSGVFTFGVQEVYKVENGEIGDLLFSTSISGKILVTLKNIVGVGKEFDRPEPSAGFCGKSGQLVPVGAAGVWLLIKGMYVGG